jgi:hypothetical protein
MMRSMAILADRRIGGGGREASGGADDAGDGSQGRVAENSPFVVTVRDNTNSRKQSVLAVSIPAYDEKSRQQTIPSLPGKRRY